MDPILKDVVQWAVVLIIIIGLLFLLWGLLNSNPLFKDLLNALDRAMKALGDQFDKCDKEGYFNVKAGCYLGITAIGGLVMKILAPIISLLSVVVLGGITKWQRSKKMVTGKDYSNKELDNLEEGAEENFKKLKEKNPNKEYTEEEELKIKKLGIVKRTAKTLKNWLKRSNKSESAKASQEQSINDNNVQIENEINPDNDPEIDAAGEEVGEGMSDDWIEMAEL